VTIYRATVLDTPDSPFTGGRLRCEQDGGVAVVGGAVVDRGSFDRMRAARPDDEIVDLRDGVLLPGLVDTHVHFPQIRAIGGLGMPLLDWLSECALPEEARLASAGYARGVADEFVDGLVRAGTTTALVFGAHFPAAVDALFERAAATGLRVSSGLVVSDRLLRPDLLTTPEEAHAEALALAARWHGK
jgi:guanine deaminase